MVVPQFTGGLISTLNDVGSNPDIGNLKEHFLWTVHCTIKYTINRPP